MNNRVLIMGPIQPPSGGVSLHIDRLIKLVENTFDIDIVDESRYIKINVFNIRSLNLFQYLKKVRKSDLIYIHSGVTVLRYFHLIIGRLASKRIIITIHSYPDIKNLILRNLDEFFFKMANKVIVVHQDILERLSLPSGKFIICTAFIPPDMNAETILSPIIINWINDRKKRSRQIICANATHLRIHNNQDLYGLDMCIEIAGKLFKDEVPVSFVYNVSSLDINEDLYLKYKAEVENSGLADNFLLTSESLSFVRLIEQSDIVLRPTNTDGDSLSVREALCLGKPVIASDIVRRPVGTILFKSRDITDFEAKIKEVIKSDTKAITDKINKPEQDYQRFYSDLLHNTINVQK